MGLAEVVQIVRDRRLPFRVYQWDEGAARRASGHGAIKPTKFSFEAAEPIINRLEELGAVLDLELLCTDSKAVMPYIVVPLSPLPHRYDLLTTT